MWWLHLRINISQSNKWSITIIIKKVNNQCVLFNWGHPRLQRDTRLVVRNNHHHRLLRKRIKCCLVLKVLLVFKCRINNNILKILKMNRTWINYKMKMKKVWKHKILKKTHVGSIMWYPTKILKSNDRKKILKIKDK